MPELANIPQNVSKSLQQSIANAMNIINKSYLQELDEYDIKEMTEEERDIDIAGCGRFFRRGALTPPCARSSNSCTPKR